jgi:integral membrane protein
MFDFLSSPLQRLRLMGRIEGCTLLLLLLIAVPLRHVAGFLIATTIMGPVHGLAFVLYAVTLIDAVSGGGWSRKEAIRAGFVAFVPFGTLINDRTIAVMIAREGAAS